MKLLLSNDDGVNAEGLGCLASLLDQYYDITVVAPDRDLSGSSSALTLSRPVRLMQHASGFYSVDGTPADCIQVGSNGGLSTPYDMVVSGINHGPNLGDDVIYSGTVAAALEGRFLPQPSIAMSLVGSKHFATAAQVAKLLVDNIQHVQLPPYSILNVNVPNVPYADLKGFQFTRLGQRYSSAPVIASHDPRGFKSFWLGPVGKTMDAEVGTDFHAVANNYVSITVLSTDMAVTSTHADLQPWLQNLSL